MRLFPLADIPVLQLSIDYNQSPEEHFETMAQIRKLRERGVLFLGSGNIVHNLREVRMDNVPYDWSIEFDQISKELIEKGDYKKLTHYEKLGKAAQMAIPTDDHYRPMLLTLGLTYSDEKPTFFNEEIDAGSVSMRSFVMG
jgi:4,5-DOPA dioxygenase extradiol